MKQRKALAVALTVGFATLLLGGCVSRGSQVKESLLINSAILAKRSDDPALFSYDNTTAKLRNFRKIIVEPVIISTATELDTVTLGNYRLLANKAWLRLVEALKEDYELVGETDGGTAKIQLAFIEATPGAPIRYLVTSAPKPNPEQAAAAFSADGKQLSAGVLYGEFKLTDARSGELLSATVDLKVDGPPAKGAWSSWESSDEALAYWGRRARFVLCERKIGPFCEKP